MSCYCFEVGAAHSTRTGNVHSDDASSSTDGATSVTHTNMYTKKHLFFFWQPPKYAVGSVVFV
jgi:hypothetical protein